MLWVALVLNDHPGQTGCAAFLNHDKIALRINPARLGAVTRVFRDLDAVHIAYDGILTLDAAVLRRPFGGRTQGPQGQTHGNQIALADAPNPSVTVPRRPLVTNSSQARSARSKSRVCSPLTWGPSAVSECFRRESVGHGRPASSHWPRHSRQWGNQSDSARPPDPTIPSVAM